MLRADEAVWGHDGTVAASGCPAGSAREAAEADVAGRGVDRFALARGGSVAQAVARRAQVRSALDHPPRDGGVGSRGAARGWGGGLVEAVRGPLPHVAGHVEEAVAVGREGAGGRSAFVAVEREVLPRKLALPGVRHGPAVRERLMAPGVGRALESSARGVLPLGLGRENLAG